MKKDVPIIDKARLYCETHGHRFTEPRRYVLEILLESKKAMGAYDIVAQLANYINNPKPTTVYRAIEFWSAQGYIHKIESLNTYIACCTDHAHNDTHFLVCDDCHTVEELHTHHHAPTYPQGFIAKQTMTETHGTCATCSEQI